MNIIQTDGASMMSSHIYDKWIGKDCLPNTDIIREAGLASILIPDYPGEDAIRLFMNYSLQEQKNVSVFSFDAKTIINSSGDITSVVEFERYIFSNAFMGIFGYTDSCKSIFFKEQCNRFHMLACRSNDDYGSCMFSNREVLRRHDIFVKYVNKSGFINDEKEYLMRILSKYR